MTTKKEVQSRKFTKKCESCGEVKNTYDDFKKGKDVCKSCQSKNSFKILH